MLFAVPLGLGSFMYGYLMVSGTEFFPVFDVVGITLTIVAVMGIAGLRLGMIFGLAGDKLKTQAKN